jgi:hypothetical protein
MVAVLALQVSSVDSCPVWLFKCPGPGPPGPPGPDGGAIAIDVIGIIYNLNFYI